MALSAEERRKLLEMQMTQEKEKPVVAGGTQGERRIEPGKDIRTASTRESAGAFGAETWTPGTYVFDEGKFQVPDKWTSEFDAMGQEQQRREAAQMEAAKIDTGAQSQFRQGQTGLVGTLESRIAGNRPSVAEEQLKAGQAANLRQAMALRSGARGLSPGAAAQMAQQSMERSNLEVGQQASALRAAEQAQAEQTLGGVLSGARGQDIGLAQAQAQLTQQAGFANLSAEQQQRAMNDQATQFYMNQGFTRDEAQAKANMALEALKQAEFADVRAKELQSFLGEHGQDIAGGQTEAMVTGGGIATLLNFVSDEKSKEKVEEPKKTQLDNFTKMLQEMTGISMPAVPASGPAVQALAPGMEALGGTMAGLAAPITSAVGPAVASLGASLAPLVAPIAALSDKKVKEAVQKTEERMTDKFMEALDGVSPGDGGAKQLENKISSFYYPQNEPPVKISSFYYPQNEPPVAPLPPTPSPPQTLYQGYLAERDPLLQRRNKTLEETLSKENYLKRFGTDDEKMEMIKEEVDREYESGALSGGKPSLAGDVDGGKAKATPYSTSQAIEQTMRGIIEYALKNAPRIQAMQNPFIMPVAQNPFVYSDEKLKTLLGGLSDKQQDDFLKAIEAKKFKYKNPDQPGTAPGQRYGVIAQDLEKTPVGKSIVRDTPQGKMIDGGQALGVILASLGRMSDRMDELDKRSKK